MEGEYCGGREAGQYGNRFAITDRKAQRLARFESDAMHQPARWSEPREDSIGQIAYALRGAARKHHHVASRERVTYRTFELGLVVGKDAVTHRLAAGFLNCGAYDRAIAVIDAGRRQRRAG